MPRTPRNLPKHELIGLKVEVEEHSDEGLEGLSGVVLDESQSFLVIGDGERMVEKKEGIFIFNLDDSRVRVDGVLIAGRPEERVKMRLPGKWE